MKKIYLPFLILLFLLPTGIQAQLFSETFINNSNIDVYKIGLTSTSNSILTGLTKVDVATNFRKTINLIWVAHNGNLQESFLYATSDNTASINCQQIIKITEDTILISGTYSASPGISFPFIMSINSLGTLNWAKKIDKSSDYSPIITLLSDNSILCIVRYNDGQTHQVYCKIDTLGNMSSFFEIDDPFKIKKDILVKNNSFDLLFIDGNLLNINNDLSAINWQRKYQNVIGTAINNTSNTDYIIATCQVAFPGYLTISRTNSQGVVLWCKYIESWQGTIQNQGTVFDVTGIHFIKEDANGNIIVSGNSEGGLNGSFQVTLDANGNYLSNYKTTSFYNTMVSNGTNEQLILGFTNQGSNNTSTIILQKVENSTFTACDIVLSHSFSNGNQVMPTPDTSVFTASTALTTIDIPIQKTNSITVINEYCNIPLSIKNVLDKSEIQIYPIPSSDYIEIKSEAVIKEINIYDLNGKLLIKSQQSKINISSLSKNTYIIEIIGAEETLTRKIIKN